MNSTFIHERTIPVPIKTVSSYDTLNEHSLNHNIIDPSKMSPPNDFMNKLLKRMDNYYSPTSKSHKEKGKYKF